MFAESPVNKSMTSFHEGFVKIPIPSSKSLFCEFYDENIDPNIG